MATEGAKFITQPYINRRAINTLNGRTRIDGESPFIQPGFDISVTQTHGLSPYKAASARFAAERATGLSLHVTQFGQVIQRTD
ncbi:hypothetical protein LOF13_06660 [Klebsiella pneumoniae subsp. pneumoniae]|nr:hypothetical protein LOF13_06660 [Klebsiella pneumoniae subsp. pneumoniae]